ncbi:50S ribosomal protein L21 [candidate division WOR-3 bacterium]|nr:50S ribosomal protein L21 [candidate division WOR-3 bacterium]
MEAIVAIAGFQYKVKEKDTLKVPKLPGKEGDKVNFPILMLIEQGKNIIGEPYVKDYTCETKILGFGKAPKIIIYKYKSKKRYRRKKGHRQLYTEILIEKITKVEEKPAKKAPEVKIKAKKPLTKKVTLKKPPVKKPVPKKVTLKKSAVKKTIAKKPTSKKVVPKKSPVKKSATRKSAPKKPASAKKKEI